MTVLSDVKLAALMLQAGFPANPKVIAEGIATIHGESGGDPTNAAQGPTGHIGLWAEEPSFGTTAQRLDPLHSTQAAYRQWKRDGGSFYPAWGRWEAEQSGKDASLNWREYIAAAARALGGKVKVSAPSHGQGKQPAKSESSGGTSGFMTFLITAALVLGGIALTGLGTMHAVGARRQAVTP